MHSDLCTSTAKAIKRQLTKLAALRAAVFGDRKVKRKALVSMLQSRDGVNLQFSQSMMYRAKNDILASADQESEGLFRRLSLILADMRDSNPGTTVHMDLDQHQLFLPGLLPLLDFDAATRITMGSCCISLEEIATVTILLWDRLVNVENELNILRFLEHCHEAGIQLSDRATFCE